MTNKYETTSDMPETENIVKLSKSEFDDLTTNAFTFGMFCGCVSTILLLILAEIIKNILN